MCDDATAALSLRNWISQAIDAVDVSDLANDSHFSVLYGENPRAWPESVRKTLALQSDSFILPALKIAHSLAAQLSDAEVALLLREHSDDTLPYYLPDTKYDWTSRVIVRPSGFSNPADGDDSFASNPLASSLENHEIVDPSDMHELVQSVVHEWTSESKAEQEIGMRKGDEAREEENDCSLAELLPPVKVNEKNSSVLSEQQRIYLLGLVFYEIFSGGERPIETRSNLVDHNPVRIDFEKGLVVSNESSDDPNENLSDTQPRRKMGRTNANNSSGMSNHQTLSVEQLRLQGVPSSVCCLIENMLECSLGDLRSTESYEHMIDVKTDLLLLIEKPNKFLRCNMPSNGSLDLSNVVYGQDKALSSLKDSYQRSLSGSCNFPMITGPSGTGKTLLANRFGEYVSSFGGVFVSGKFDQHHQATPFMAITHAFNEYCSFLVADTDSNDAISVVSSLREALGGDASYLTRVIPNLSLFLDDIGECNEHIECVNTEKRLQYLLCRFVETVSISSKTPVTLFLDDLQWADPASIALIRLLLLSKPTRFFILGSYRDFEISQDDDNWKTIGNLSDFGVNTQIIKMTLMDKDCLNDAVSDLLCLSPRLTRPLSDIVHHKTKGNPLFFTRLMARMVTDGLLQFRLSCRRWVWDEENIQSRKIPDDVAEFFTNAIGMLSPDALNALCTLSCFGASVEISVIKILEDGLGIQLQESFDVAVSEGFLDKTNHNYSFSHDRIQEAAYIHVQIQTSDNKSDDALFFTAVDQINRAGTSFVVTSEQGSLMAQMNLQAGMKAIDMSDFLSALNFFEFGMKFLWQNHWDEEYDLSLSLYNNAAKCSLALGDGEKLETFSAQVVSNARSFEDKLHVYYLSISSLCHASLLEEAFSKGVQVLSILGEELSLTLSYEEKIGLVKETASLLSSLSDDELLNYRIMSDPTKIMAMKFLWRLEMSLLLGKPSFMPLITVKMIQMSLTHGMSAMSAIGFVYFGNIVASKVNITDGYRLVKLSRHLVQYLGCKEVAGEVIAMSTQTIGYVEPIQSTLELNLQGHTAALQSGDITSACLNLIIYCNQLFWSGASLKFTTEKYKEVTRFIKKHNNTALALVAGTRMMDKLCETNENIRNADSDGPAEDVLRIKNPFAANMLHFNNTFIAFIYRDFDSTVTSMEKYFDGKLEMWTLLNFTAGKCFIIGLASFWIYRRTKDRKWYERGSQSIEAMRKWAESSKWNFLQKFLLLEAEDHFCNQRYEKAKKLYDNAILRSRQHKFINDEAIACELTAYFLLELGETDSSLEYIIQAHKNYHTWGATGKASVIFKYFQSISVQGDTTEVSKISKPRLTFDITKLISREQSQT
ncbi:hypothetical protein ACHAXS_006557 [Conticribra weissflogii]